MKTYQIFNRETGELVAGADYVADAPVEWDAWPFALFEHRELVAPPAPPATLPTLYGGRRKITKLEWRKLLLPDEEEAFDEIRANVETMALPDGLPRAYVRTFVNRYNEATIMDLDDVDQPRGFGLMVALGKMAYNRIEVILHG